jgi:hypothetical protein
VVSSTCCSAASPEFAHDAGDALDFNKFYAEDVRVIAGRCLPLISTASPFGL